MIISPDAHEFVVVVDGVTKYRTDSLKRARSLRRFERIFHRHVVIFGVHTLVER